MTASAETLSTATVPRADGTLPGRSVRFAFPFFIFLLISYVLPPPRPTLAETNLLDQSWRLILSDAFLHGTQFGRDLVHTYGPWGFVGEPQGDPRIYPWLLAARLLIAAAFVFGVSIIALRKIRSPIPRALFLAWIMIFADPIYVLPAVLFALASFRPAENDRISRLTIHLLAVACALTMWIKFTSFVAVAALAVVLALQDLFQRRRPLIALEITAAAGAFWFVARQSPLNLPAFMHGALSTAASYSGAMFTAGAYSELPLVAALLLAVAIPAALIVYRTRQWPLWPSLVWVALLFFLQLKEAFVRYDPFHVWMGLVNALLPCALILICRAGYFDPPRTGALTRICAAVVVLLAIALTLFEIPGVAGFERFQIFTRNMDSLKAIFAGHSLSADYRRHLAEFRRVKPLRQVNGTAAFFPDDQALLFGNGIQSDLPPVPQSFEAYNGFLSGRNAAFYRSARRPDYVFFDVHPVDKRYPAIADPLSWLALLDCYVPDGNSGSYLVLRSAPCRNSSLDLISRLTAHAGELVAVPDGGGDPVWAEIEVRLNTAGSIVALFTRPPATVLSVGAPTGRHRYGLPPETARAGFLLSPEILATDSFAALYSSNGGAPAAAVRSIAVIQSGLGQRLSRAVISFRFYRVRLAHRG